MREGSMAWGVAQLTNGMTDESRLELKALQEQISALAPKVDGLVAKEGTGVDVQERMESLREELCAALRDDVRQMLKKEKDWRLTCRAVVGKLEQDEEMVIRIRPDIENIMAPKDPNAWRT